MGLQAWTSPTHSLCTEASRARACRPGGSGRGGRARQAPRPCCNCFPSPVFTEPRDPWLLPPTHSVTQQTFPGHLLYAGSTECSEWTRGDPCPQEGAIDSDQGIVRCGPGGSGSIEEAPGPEGWGWKLPGIDNESLRIRSYQKWLGVWIGRGLSRGKDTAVRADPHSCGANLRMQSSLFSGSPLWCVGTSGSPCPPPPPACFPTQGLTSYSHTNTSLNWDLPRLPGARSSP